ncbi:MAG TPA: hypothetical protein VLS48_02940, partial [Anaerolineales bacterium]|nr:hypothetical protein [Anaerolineales bacterium]
TIPNIFLAAWSAAARLSGKDMRRQLLRFVIPVSVLTALLATGVYMFFIDRTPVGSFPSQLLVRLNVGNAPLFYAQMAVTWALLATGWLRVLFLQPPTPFWVGGARLRADARVFGVLIFVITLLVILLIFPFLPFQAWLRLSWLPGGLADYLILGAAALLWAILVRFVWRQIWPDSLSRLNLSGLRRLSRAGASQV